MSHRLPFLLLLLLSATAFAQTNRLASGTNSLAHIYLQEHYTKYEYKIPMRDGVKLFTAIYTPKDDAKPYPILLTRTPYGLKPYGEDIDTEPVGLIFYYATNRFIFASQDVRGRCASEGQFVHMRPVNPN